MKGKNYLLKKFKILFISTVLILGLFFQCNTTLAESLAPSYYDFLSKDQQAVYNQVFEQSTNYGTDKFKMAAKLSELQLELTMDAFYNDHPEIFWLNTTYYYGINRKGLCTILQLDYAFSASELPSAMTNYNRMLENLITGASQYSTPLEKEIYLHDAICSLNTYDSSSSYSQSAYSALTSGYSVCAGYARAFQVACLNCGIPCYYVTGESKGQDHAWNIVYIDGKYQNVDLTWDDCIADATGQNSYYYFNKSDSFFSSDHSRTGTAVYLSPCD